MKLPHFLTKDYQLPPLPSCSYRDVLFLLTFFIVPNLFFLGIAWFTHTSRPLFNLDYFLVGILFFLPKWLGRILGSITFALAVIFDCLMLIVQIFPFLDVHAIRYFLPFIHTAPTPYLVGIGMIMLYILIMPFVFVWLTRKQNRFYATALSIIIILISPIFMMDLKYNNYEGIMGRNNYYYINSQFNLYREFVGNDFVLAGNMLPKIIHHGTKQKQATAQLQQPYSDKILLVVVESWGKLRKPEAQQQILQKLEAQKDRFEFLEQGYFDFVGATVNGELRELCHFYSTWGYKFALLDDQVFAHCLPIKLKNQGYHTIGMHGTSGLLYDRVAWYPKAGFQQAWFGEHFLNEERCIAFKGVCDTALMGTVAETFKKYQNEKVFLYWLTLTAHQPYVQEDIYNTRFNCTQFGMKDNGEICRNARLHTQFFDSLAELVQKPEMKGVEVILVGDHMPPMVREDTRPHLQWNDVSWLHFKIKK